MKKEIKLLKAWLAVEGNTAPQIAVALGYKSSVTIEQWVARQNIPSHQKPKVMEIISGKAIGPGQKGEDQETAPAADLLR